MISVLIATSGRDTLNRTIASVLPQLGNDELVVVADGEEAFSRATAMWPACVPVPGGCYHDFGHTPRNLMISSVGGSWVLHLDDDDTLAPNALPTVRSAIAENTNAVHLFRVLYPDGTWVWRTKIVIENNVGTGTIVHRKEHAGIFLSRYGGDFNFVRTTIENSGVDPVWHEDYIIRIRQ